MNEQQRAVVQQALEVLRRCQMNESYRNFQQESDTITALRQLLEQPEPVQEPVGKWMGKCIEWTENPYKFKKGQSIYTTPPAQPAAWVGLTDEQILAESEHWSPSAVFIEGAKWADAKLREKNGGKV
jgi:hypothetical protein